LTLTLRRKKAPSHKGLLARGPVDIEPYQVLCAVDQQGDQFAVNAFEDLLFAGLSSQNFAMSII